MTKKRQNYIGRDLEDVALSEKKRTRKKMGMSVLADIPKITPLSHMGHQGTLEIVCTLHL